MSVRSFPGNDCTALGPKPPSLLAPAGLLWHSHADHTPCVHNCLPGAAPQLHGAVRFSGTPPLLAPPATPPPAPGARPSGAALAPPAEHAAAIRRVKKAKPPTET